MQLQNLTAVELFAGIGGFRLAADAHGIETIWANDLDPTACAVYRHRFGAGQLHEGDIRKLKDEIPPHAILTGGFPCQPFSSAGKKEGIRDPRGTLFQEIVSILEQHHPKVFVLENVKRLLHMESGGHFATILSALASLDYQIEWRLLNAKNFGLPQNRERLAILGLSKALTGTDGFNLNHVYLAPVADFADTNERDLNKIHTERRWSKLSKHSASFPSWGLANKSSFVASELCTFSEAAAPIHLADVLQENPPAEFDFTENTLQRLTNNEQVNRFVNGVEILSNQGGGARMGYTIFGVNGLAPTLTASTSRHYERYRVGQRYRRLTNIEYARIQGFPDDHCEAASVYNQYVLFGNAVPPPMMSWVLQRLSGIGSIPPQHPVQQLEIPVLLNDPHEL